MTIKKLQKSALMGAVAAAIGPVGRAHSSRRGESVGVLCRCGYNASASADVGHIFAFGNTLEKETVLVYGCKERGRPTEPPFDHSTGRGYVKGRKGQYSDALVNKKNSAVLLLHDNYGGIAPPTLKHFYLLARGTRIRDGTDYTSWAAPSFIPHYGQKLSSAAVFADAAIIRDGILKLSANSAMAA